MAATRLNNRSLTARSPFAALRTTASGISRSVNHRRVRGTRIEATRWPANPSRPGVAPMSRRPPTDGSLRASSVRPASAVTSSSSNSAEVQQPQHGIKLQPDQCPPLGIETSSSRVRPLGRWTSTSAAHRPTTFLTLPDRSVGHCPSRLLSPRGAMIVIAKACPLGPSEFGLRGSRFILAS